MDAGETHINHKAYANVNPENGIPMEYTWNDIGMHWNPNGIHMEYTWNTMEYTWNPNGIHMEFLT